MKNLVPISYVPVSYKDAGTALVKALTAKQEGFIARVGICQEQTGYAKQLAWVRRVAAKRAIGQDYTDATDEPDSAEEQARLVADARALLTEIIVHDALKAARAKFDMQALVSFNTEHDPDLQLNGEYFDVKSAGQASPSWQHGVVKSYRLTDDRMFTIRGDDARHYAGKNAAGFVCVYVYIERDMPYAADIFFVSADTVASQTERAATLSNKSASWHGIDVAFPDALVHGGKQDRLKVLEEAGYMQLPRLADAKATYARAACAAEAMATLRYVSKDLTEMQCLNIASYIKQKLFETKEGEWQSIKPTVFALSCIVETDHLGAA